MQQLAGPPREARGQEDRRRAANPIRVSAVHHLPVEVSWPALEEVGEALERGTGAYNRAIGSLERMVLPSSRKLKKLHATTEKDIVPPAPIEVEIRPVTAPELKPAPPLEAPAQDTEGVSL